MAAGGKVNDSRRRHRIPDRGRATPATSTSTGVSVSDPLLGTPTAGLTGGDRRPADVLDVGETWTYTGTYTVTQADLDDNGIDATARRRRWRHRQHRHRHQRRTARRRATARSSRSAATPPTPSSRPSPTWVATAPTASADAAGDIIEYQIVVEQQRQRRPDRRRGHRPAAGALNGPTGRWRRQPTSLDVGETWTYTGTYAVTQADLDATASTATACRRDGDIDNTATVSSDELPDPKRTARMCRSAVTPPTASSRPSPTWAAMARNGIIDAAGDIIEYQIVVSNDGNVDLTGVSVTDPLLGANGRTGRPAMPATASVLDVGETWTYTGTYTVTRPTWTNGIDSNGVPTTTATSTTPPPSPAPTARPSQTTRLCRSWARPSYTIVSPSPMWAATARRLGRCGRRRHHLPDRGDNTGNTSSAAWW